MPPPEVGRRCGRTVRLSSGALSLGSWDPGSRPGIVEEALVSKKTKKRKLRSRRNKANHGRKPNAGR
jgi:hypothetical protein